ncbi:MAG TPA: hypothetical protein VHV83_06475, partial [Armatimonadota bacterium]|nr:hypothetical protein [Armatimonadota bacterium]
MNVHTVLPACSERLHDLFEQQHHLLMYFALFCCALIIMTGAYAATEPVGTGTDDFSGKISIGKIEADRPIFAFAHGSGGELRFEVKNSATTSVDLTCAFTLSERAGAQVRESTQAVTLAAGTTKQVVYPVDPDTLRYAVYDLDVKVTATADKKQRELARANVALGIISATQLRKANPGDFLYGLDPCLGRASDIPGLLEWTRVMGTDILRSPFTLWEGRRPNFDMVKEVMDRMPIYKTYGLRVMIGMGPEPPAQQPNWRLSYEDYKKKMEDFAERLGKIDPESFSYWELGNEPDIDFYQGPKEQYAKDYIDLYNAIKRSNPNALVFNGGFAYDVDNTRKILQLIGPEHLDVVAYHAHGPGVGAERRGYQSIRRIMTALNYPATIRVIDTESGMDAQGANQEITQGITAIEKLVFGQVQSMPAFFWFRLRFEHADSYTTVKLSDPRQPRPAVLSYRATVETLRGLKYERSLDFGVDGLECHLFRTPGGNTQCAVLWMNLDAPVQTSNIHLAVASSADAVRGLQLIDMFGNPSQLTPTTDGRVRLTVGTRPIFVKWDATQPDFHVAVGRPEIASPAVADINIGHPRQLQLVVRNPEKKSLTGTVHVAVHAQQHVRVSPDKVWVKLAPGEE